MKPSPSSPNPLKRVADYSHRFEPVGEFVGKREAEGATFKWVHFKLGADLVTGAVPPQLQGVGQRGGKERPLIKAGYGKIG